jgi:FixJ family two-component response regulator
MSEAAATIHLIDDDEAVLKALRRLLGTAGHHVEVYDCAEDFLRRHDPDAPGCAVVDLRLPGMGGFDIQDALSSRDADCPIIFLTGRGDIPDSVRAMKAGAVDFLTKPVDAACLLAAVSLALERDADARRSSQQRHVAERRIATLTSREREVMGCVVAGRLNKQIAAELGTVEKTIKVHRGRMMEKMGVRNVADLVRLSSLVQGT